MQYKNKLQPASFRGVPFGVKDISTTLGRRTILHEYPLRDDPYAEDLGRKAREFQINAFVMTPDDFGASERLRSALEDQSAPGTLVHPSMGQMQVVVKECTHNYSNSEGGIEYYSVSFVESLGNNFPNVSIDTQSRLRSSVAGLIRTSNTYFASRFAVVGYPDFISHSAVTNLNTFATQFRNLINFGSARNGNPANYSRLIASLTRFQSTIPTLISTPDALAGQIVNLNASFNASFANNLDLAQLLQSRLFLYGDDFLAVDPITNLRIVEKNNQNQTIYLIKILALSALILNISSMTFVSSQDAIAARDAIDSKAYPLMQELANNFQDEIYTQLRDTVSAMVLDIKARSADTASIRTFRIADSKPAVTLAYEFLDNAKQEDDIVNRNKIVNPLFVPAFSDIKVAI